MALSAERDAVLVAHPNEGTVGLVGLHGSLNELRLDGEPTRITQAQGRYFVTLRQARAVAVLEIASDGSLTEVQRIHVGAEPYGVVAPEDQAHVYVAVALEGVVKEIDSQSLQITRTFDVQGEPRFMAYHPDGVIYAVSAWNGFISAIQLESGKVEQFRLPVRESFSPDNGKFELDRRASGDPAVTPDGKQLLVPAMYLDTETAIVEPTSLDDLEDREDGAPPDGGGYSTDRFNPAVAVIPVGKGGKLHTSDGKVISAISHTNDPDLEFRAVIGYPSSVSVTPDGTMMFVTIEGSEGVTALATEFGEDQDSGFFDRVFGGADDFFEGAVAFRPTAAVVTDAGPRSIVTLNDDKALVFNFLDRSVQSFDTNTLRLLVIRRPGGGEVPIRNHVPNDGDATLRAVHLAESTTARLPADIEIGRRLFYSTGDSRMSANGSGVSCATCHADGRTDGMSWAFERGKRQTPSLAGEVSLTEPVRWEGDRVTVKEDALFTSQGLMGGSKIQDAELDALVAFIDFTPRVDSPLRGSSNEAVRRGQSIFERADVGCAGCHTGAVYTDNRTYSMFGLSEVQTRSLVGLAGSPPYLHDGSASTLRDVLERARDGSMGNTASLSEAEMADLEQYLRSL